MSTELRSRNGVSITRFAGGESLGTCYQVTWKSTTGSLGFQWVAFQTEYEAEMFADLLENTVLSSFDKL